MKRIFTLCLILSGLLSTLLLTGCASTLRSDVTSFQRWPANAAGSTYSFKRNAWQESSLEHKTYEDLARVELNKQGLKEAVPSTKGRFEVSLDYGVNTRTVKSREPIYGNGQYWHPAHYHPTYGWRPGYWAADPWGPQVVGYQTVQRDISTRRLRVDITEGANKVFEASATSNGSNATLTVTMPYLIRSVFDGFPGTNGQSRSVEFDTESGAIKGKQLAAPG
jgi:Domain of unknown function (DUF4136)